MTDFWDRMRGWDLLLPPSRPSSAQLDHIRAKISRIERDGSAAVLGSTPEFRDLLGQLGFSRVVVFDKNARFYAQMSSACVEKHAETFVEGDWLATLGDWREAFSVILSDLTSGNVEYDQRARFYELVEDALCPGGGLFFDKVLTNEKRLLTVREIEDKYSWTPVNLQSVNYFSCEAIFCSELITDSRVVDTSVIYDRLASALPRKRLQAFLRHAELITPRECVWYYGRPWTNLMPSYCPRLTRLESISMPDDGPYMDRVRHQLMSKV
jgi:hypothetical protein